MMDSFSFSVAMGVLSLVCAVFSIAEWHKWMAGELAAISKRLDALEKNNERE